MANISDAVGHIELQDVWTNEQLRALAYLLLSQNNGANYSIVCDHSVKEIINIFAQNDRLDFVANGRWAFHNNLQSLHYWSDLNPQWWENVIRSLPTEERITHAKYLELRSWLFKEMFANNLKIYWDFMDFEPGVGFLDACSGVHYVKYDKDKNEYELSYSGDVTESFDCNLKNYCEVFLQEDSSSLYDVVSEILRFYKLDEVDRDAITSLIKQHDTWYDLSPFPWFEKKTDIPMALRKSILKLVKVGSNDYK